MINPDTWVYLNLERVDENALNPLNNDPPLWLVEKFNKKVGMVKAQDAMSHGHRYNVLMETGEIYSINDRNLEPIICCFCHSHLIDGPLEQWDNSYVTYCPQCDNHTVYEFIPNIPYKIGE